MPQEVALLGFSTIICGTIVLVYGIRSWATRGRLKAQSQLPKGVDQRLERIEQAVDAIAIEVERISEGQRFTTKLLADRATEAQRPGRAS